MPQPLTAQQHQELTTALQAGDLTGISRPVLIMLCEMVRKSLDAQFPQFATAIDAGFALVEKLLGGP